MYSQAEIVAVLRQLKIESEALRKSLSLLSGRVDSIPRQIPRTIISEEGKELAVITPEGDIDGVNNVFRIPNAVSNLILSVDGITRTEFSLVGDMIIMDFAPVPDSVLVAYYEIAKSTEVKTNHNSLPGINTGDYLHVTLEQKEYIDTIKDKVNKIEGKSLSTNDLTNELKDKYDSVVTKLPIQTPQLSGTTITFVQDRVYGSYQNPETSNIIAEELDAILGVTNLIIHNSSVPPAFSSNCKRLNGSPVYQTGVVNYIYCTYIAPDTIIYSINQVV